MKKLMAAGSGLATALVLTGCGGGSTGSADTAATEVVVAAPFDTAFTAPGATAPSAGVAPDATSPGIECLFNWLEANNAASYAPAGGSSLVSGLYYYRSYAGSGSTLAVAGGSVWKWAGSAAATSVGTVAGLLASSQCDAVDTAAPAMTYASRTDGTGDAAVNSLVVAGFSEPMDAASLKASVLQVKSAAGATVGGSLRYDPAHLALVFDPAQPLSGGEKYQVTLNAEIKDLAGKALKRAYGWSVKVDGARKDTEEQRQVQWLLDRRVYQNAIPGGLMAVRYPDGTVWKTSSGYSRLDEPAPITKEMYFKIGSNTKTLVATAVLQLVAEGRFGLDDPMSKVLPAAATYLSNYDTSKITLRHVLQHTSGLVNFTEDGAGWGALYASDPTQQYTPLQLLAISNANAQYGNPLGTFHYSNTNYVLLGLVLSAYDNVPFETSMRNRVLDPARLSTLYLPFTGDLTIDGPYSRGYWANPALANLMVDVTMRDPSTVWSSGDANATIGDLAKWGHELGTGSLITPALQQQRLANLMSMGEKVPYLNYGLGIVKDARINGVGHQGGMIGYTSQVYYLPDVNATVAFFYNRSLSMYDYSQVATYAALKMLFPQRYGQLQESFTPFTAPPQ